MIFTTIINGFLDIFDNIISALPAVNSGIDWSSNMFTTFNNAVFDHIGLIDLFVPLNLFFGLFKAVIVILLGKWIFDLIMFVLRKIPVASLD